MIIAVKKLNERYCRTLLTELNRHFNCIKYILNYRAADIYQKKHIHSQNHRLYCHYSHNSNFVNQKTMSVFKFNDYDCIGFDLDNTLLWYNVTNVVQLEYNILAKYLVEEKGYDANYLCKPLLDKDIDFMQKGLCIDFERGNILRFDYDGVIRKVSHGMNILTLEEIQKIYPEQRWNAIETFRNNPIASWNGPGSLNMRNLLDYFDMPASLAFARAVDSIDSKTNRPIEKYTIWPDILKGLINMYERTHFKKNLGSYFPHLKNNPDKYLRKCSQKIINWLREMKKKNKVIFLITGSHADFADFTATYTIGEDWKSLFDIIICYAKKPGFFTENRPFISLIDNEEDMTISGKQLIRGGMYSQGNWTELKEFFKIITKNDLPKCLYVGDNLIQDIYVPAACSGLDTIVVSEEMHAEGLKNELSPHPDTQIMISNYWGSYFSIDESTTRYNSFWCGIIENYSKICIPSLQVVADQSFDKSYKAFDKNTKNQNGYYPEKSIDCAKI